MRLHASMLANLRNVVSSVLFVNIPLLLREKLDNDKMSAYDSLHGL